MGLQNYEVVYPATSLPAFKGKLLGLDIETAPRMEHPKAGLDPYMTRISLIQIYDGDTCYVFDVLAEGIPSFLLDLFANPEYSFIGHNSNFEITHLQFAGARFKGAVHCTMLMSQLIGSVAKPVEEKTEKEEDIPISEMDGLGAYKKTSHSLEACMLSWLSTPMEKQYQTSKWGERPLSEGQLRYAAFDAVGCFELFRIMIRVLGKYEMLGIYKLQRLSLFPIVDMEVNGIAFDWVAHERLIKKWKEDFIALEDDTRRTFGTVTGPKGIETWLNLASPKQLATWLEVNRPELFPRWPRTAPSKTAPLGNLTFTQTALADFRHLPEMELLFKWKKLNKLLTTYGEKFAEKHRHPITGRLHTSFTLGETATGRMSSRSPNLQNQPRDGSIRQLFVSPVDKVLIVADFSQIELRIQAEVSKDPKMLAAFRDGTDIYKVMAAALFNIAIEEVTKEQRMLGKVAMLSLGYGTGAKKLRSTARSVYDLEIDEAQAYSVHATYYHTFSTYIAWCESVRLEADMTGMIATLGGKKRKVEPSRGFTVPPNHIIQGTAMEVQLLASCKAKDAGGKLLLSVHDELLLESTPSKAEKDCRILEDAMNEAWCETFPNTVCKHVADAAIGKNWKEAKEKS